MQRNFREVHLHPYDSIDKEKHHYDESYMRESLKERKKRQIQFKIIIRLTCQVKFC